MAPMVGKEQLERPGSQDDPGGSSRGKINPKLTEDHLPGNRTPSDGEPRAPGGAERPKDDRRKRGDLQKRGLP